MDINAEKLEVIQTILNIEDIEVIKKAKQLIDQRKKDWFDGLTEEQQQSVMRSLEKLDRGEFFTHEEAKARLGL